MNLTIMCDIDGILDQLKQLQYVDLTRPSPAFRVRGSGFVRLGKKNSPWTICTVYTGCSAVSLFQAMELQVYQPASHSM